MKRCIKKRTNKDVPRGEEGEKEGGGGGKGAYVAVLTRNTDEDPQWFRDASQVVSLWMSNHLDTTTGNMRRSVRGKGQDYKFSSFRTPKRTEVENNPQPYPARGNSLSHWWQIGCHFQKRLKTMACAQLEQSLQSTHSCIRPPFFSRMCNYRTSRPIAVKASTTPLPAHEKRGFALKWAESIDRYMMNFSHWWFFWWMSEFTARHRFRNTTTVGGQHGSVFTLQLLDKSHRHPGTLGVKHHLALRHRWEEGFLIHFLLQMINSFL